MSSTSCARDWPLPPSRPGVHVAAAVSASAPCRVRLGGWLASVAPVACSSDATVAARLDVLAGQRAGGAVEGLTSSPSVSAGDAVGAKREAAKAPTVYVVCEFPHGSEDDVHRIVLATLNREFARRKAQPDYQFFVEEIELR